VLGGGVLGGGVLDGGVLEAGGAELPPLFPELLAVFPPPDDTSLSPAVQPTKAITIANMTSILKCTRIAILD
jgi:hypothetical protein